MEGILLSVVSLIGPLWLWKHQTGKSGDTSEASKYHCVSIKHRRGACKAIMALEGKRFLPDEAPTFPLPDCDAKRCKCRYVHHDDRRHDSRRSTDSGYPKLEFDGQERRGQRGRRWTDRLPKRHRSGFTTTERTARTAFTNHKTAH